MSRSDSPEWISATVADVTRHTPKGRERVRLRVGIVQMPHGGGRRAASQVDGEPELYILPPASIPRIIGALYRGLKGG